MANQNQPRDNARPIPDPGQSARSENLIPADGQPDDGRFEVAEEVNLDQQSDSTRRIGQASPDPAPDLPGTPGTPQ